MEKRNVGKQLVQQLADDLGAKVEFLPALPDGSGAAVMSIPLSKEHWIYEPEGAPFVAPPMPFRMGRGESVTINGVTMSRHEVSHKIASAARYAVKAATMNGTEMDFDPDALIQNLMVGLFGYYTENGFTDDGWANPPADGSQQDWEPGAKRDQERSKQWEGMQTQSAAPTTPSVEGPSVEGGKE